MDSKRRHINAFIRLFSSYSRTFLIAHPSSHQICLYSCSFWLLTNPQKYVTPFLMDSIHLSRVGVIKHINAPFSNTRDIQLEGREGLEEGRVKRHVHRRRRPTGLNVGL